MINPELADLGLSAFYTRQLSTEELERDQLARVIEIQRTGVIATNGVDEWVISLGGSWFRGSAELRPTVGDWVLLDESRDKITRVLERKSVFKRVAAGTRLDVQLIAANVDTLFIVTSCNDEFNESRLERYLALAIEAGVDPVIVLTKTDLVDDVESYRERVRSVGADLSIDSVNARDPESLNGLLSWLTKGATAALVGSSGVGKSTILNSLLGVSRMETGAIREQDAKGRHTTSFRSLHRLPGGGILLDVPGIRELKIAEVDQSLSELFEDIETLASQCKYSNCSHQEEPGCVIRAAIEDGSLDPRRLGNYDKLIQEEARNAASLAEQRSRSRQFSKTVKQHVNLKRKSNKHFDE